MSTHIALGWPRYRAHKISRSIKRYGPLRVSSLSLYLYLSHLYRRSSDRKKRRRGRSSVSRCAVMHGQTIRRGSAKYPHRLATDTWSRYSGGLKLRHRHRNSVSLAPGIGDGQRAMKKIFSTSLSPFLPASLFFYHAGGVKAIYTLPPSVPIFGSVDLENS